MERRIDVVNEIDNSLELPGKKPMDMSARVRPSIAWGLLVLVVYLGVTGKIPPEQIIALFGPIVGFYFGERSARKAA